MGTVNMADHSDSKDAPDTVHGLMKKLKVLENLRAESFKNWQYDETDNCSIQKMAEAGFFYTGTNDGDDDSSTCFVCGKVLDGWERHDDPWNEHEKHAPNCHFVQIHLAQEDLTTEQFINLAVFVLKGHITSVFTKKLAGIQKRSDEILNVLKTQQL